MFTVIQLSVLIVRQLQGLLQKQLNLDAIVPDTPISTLLTKLVYSH